MRTAKEIVSEAGNGSVLHTQIVLDQTVLVSRQPFSFIPRDDAPLRSPARLGEHTEEGLRDWLGLTAAEIQQLQEVGALQ